MLNHITLKVSDFEKSKEFRENSYTTYQGNLN
jgi:catechol 2,3-dioxygenase-like lactoylglutathione lyase family enzyme